MGKVSKQSASHVEDRGLAEDRYDDVEGFTINFVTIREDADLAPMLKGLPGDMCHCPHWGYVFKGRLTWRIAGREEVYEAGDAFCVPAGHTPKADAGAEFVQFSPAEELKTVTEAIKQNMQKMQAMQEA